MNDATPAAGDQGRCPECGLVVEYVDHGGGFFWWHVDEVAGLDHEPNGARWKVLPL
jgi:hypothetical protein